MSLHHLAAAMLLLACGAPQAALLCEGAPCRLELEFAEGGAIEAPAGATISFGAGGLLDLGIGGSIDYGSGGSAVPSTPGSAVPVLSSGGSIVLGPGGSIHFGRGGRLSGGDAAQFESPDNGVVDFRDASRVQIDSDSAVHVGPVRRFGDVLIEARRVDSAPAPFRFAGRADSDFVLRSADVAWIEWMDEIGNLTINATESAVVYGPPSGDGGSGGSGAGVVIVGSPGTPSGSGGSSGSGSISLGSGGGTVESTGGSTGSPGTVTLEPVSPGELQVLDDGRGGGAFPGLLLALFATLGCAARRKASLPG
ncbi:hypothetical protein D0B54_20195 [Solimonas sp. K1W22B-7]|uniref:hypothetical protein n=1 Tax=Solimonas sp. K1W22B-7 TaxID=2303331 RepID=UPI000E333C85|nr:hypothetical protein [Solimonas sp. K1W22B-7]AXQ30861.1 hypothetical protein D0B54_20195 [Solimonas sp. K1W22B-7]